MAGQGRRVIGTVQSNGMIAVTPDRRESMDRSSGCSPKQGKAQLSPQKMQATKLKHEVARLQKSLQLHTKRMDILDSHFERAQIEKARLPKRIKQMERDAKKIHTKLSGQITNKRLTILGTKYKLEAKELELAELERDLAQSQPARNERCGRDCGPGCGQSLHEVLDRSLRAGEDPNLDSLFGPCVD